MPPVPKCNLVGVRILAGLEESEMEILGIALSLAKAFNKTNPYTDAILKIGEKNSIPAPIASFFKEEPGFGMGAVIANRAVIMGNLEFMSSCNLECPLELSRAIAEEESLSREALCLGWEAQVRALLVFDKNV